MCSQLPTLRSACADEYNRTGAFGVFAVLVSVECICATTARQYNDENISSGELYTFYEDAVAEK